MCPLSAGFCVHVLNQHTSTTGSMAGVHITPLQVGGGIDTGVPVTVNGSAPPGSSLSQSVVPQVLSNGGVTITPIQSSRPKPELPKLIVIDKAFLKAVTKKQAAKRDQLVARPSF